MSKYEMEDLLPLVSKLAKQYTSNESSSITYEKANQLMGAVLYCIEECENVNGIKNKPKDITIRNEEAAAYAYEEGYRFVCEKIRKANQLYVTIIDRFDSYGCICYEETITKGMPAFFQHYDVRFAPQETLLTLDYPTICPVFGLTGVDAIYQYLKYISLEQLFLSKLPRQYVMNVLEAYEPGYEELFDNVAKVVYRNLIGHLLANKKMEEHGYSKKEYEELSIMITMRTNKELKEQIGLLLEKLIRREYNDDNLLFEYLVWDLDDFIIELRNAADHNVLETIFPI